MSRIVNWTDLFNEPVAYAVLRKRNRLQVLLQPSHKQLRRRGKRNWSLVAAVPVSARNGNHTQDIPDDLRDAVLQALAELAVGGRPKGGKKSKKKGGDLSRVGE
jgi:hypothetical protein